jgi:peptidoglycan hydrolase CwlO-like protein
MVEFISLGVGILLTVSEILPFVSNIRANGLIHLLTTVGNDFLKKSSTVNEESSPLLLDNGYNEDRDNEDRYIEDNSAQLLELLNTTSEIKTAIDSMVPKVDDMSGQLIELAFSNSQELTEINSGKYEMNFIINFIKFNYPKRRLQLPSLLENNKIQLKEQGYTVQNENGQVLIKW